MALSCSSNLASSPFRILCFGDSLTAGAYPPKFRNFPYAPHLENALLNNCDQLLKPGIAVWHKGKIVARQSVSDR
eukprot:scaffold575_cov104-Cylindrotheca_fusiformis.AAC.1